MPFGQTEMPTHETSELRDRPCERGWIGQALETRAARGPTVLGAAGPGAREQGLICGKWYIRKINQVAECR